MLRVFISSTYRDLEDYRAAVAEQLERMQVAGVGMEYFGSSGDDPTTFSLEELEKCNVYVGIVGHRFGSPSPDNEERSITQREYDRACELHDDGQMDLLLYLADDEVRLSPNLVESDDIREKQQKFRGRLSFYHTPWHFKSPHELASWVGADLYKLRERGTTRDPEATKVFHPGDWPVMKDEFDSLADDRLARIRRFLNSLVQSFTPLFRIDRRDWEVHPLFKEAHKQLDRVIPGVYLDDEGGILRRTDVRHVILRTQTAQLLVGGIKDEEALFKIGEEIGTGAASDLIEKAVKTKRLIPASEEAFVALWDYWDRTGGWGKLHLVKTSNSDGLDQATQQSPPQPEWRIKIENNFLAINDSDEMHRLNNFWRGYIKGVLNEALPRITTIMNDLKQEDRRKVTLPSYQRVVEVTHEADNTLAEDIFHVRFEVQRFAGARQTVDNAERNYGTRDYETAMGLCQLAVVSMERELEPDFDLVLGRMSFPVATVAIINELRSDTIPPADKEKARKWIDTTKLLIEEFDRELRDQR